MAYDPAVARPQLVATGIGASSRTWHLKSTDSGAEIAGATITDGLALGMRPGDLFINFDTNNSYAQTTHSVTAVSATTGIATISAAT